LRSQIGIVEQEPFLFSCSIRENITYGVGDSTPQEEIEQAAKFAAIHDVIMSFPKGYDTLVGERGVTLSGGQKALHYLMKERTTFIIAHRIQSIMNADLILVFDKGHIVQSGSHKELLQVPGMYREIFDIQTRIDVALEKEIASANS